MLPGSVVVAIALAYLGCLFAVASYGDRMRPAWMGGRARPYIYALGLSVYCTSWTFFGSVGLASSRGFDFLTIYIGPALVIGLGVPLVLRIVRLAKAQNITSIADFIAARYGKSQAVAALVSIAAVIGALPYIALQLKAVSLSLSTVLEASTLGGRPGELPVFGDLALLVALVLAVFAILFGTRHVDATEHQDGLMLAIAMESVVKLVAFLAVGLFVTYGMFDGLGDILAKAREADIADLEHFLLPPDAASWTAMIVLSACCALLLPRQFHVTVVESRSETEVRRAAWLFPLYLVLINLFVAPIAIAGLVVFDGGRLDSDMFVLALPLEAGSRGFAILAFLGGLSAATAMVIVESVALSIMVSNDLFVPLFLRGRDGAAQADMGRLLLVTRRAAILLILVLAYVYYRAAGTAQLAHIGLLSFAAIAQFAPAFFGGLFWRGGTARGAMAGILIGLAVWAYTLLLPNFAASGLFGTGLVEHGAFGLAWLRPAALLGLELDPLAHGVFWSLSLNAIAYVLVSLADVAAPIERLQADAFVGGERFGMGQSFQRSGGTVTIGTLRTTVGRYLGPERTERSFEIYAADRGLKLDPAAEADIHMLRFSEHLLASAIGAASSRLVLSLLLRDENLSTRTALQLLDAASAAIQSNRDLLQTALDQARQGISVFDKDLRLVCWNQEFCRLFDLPPRLVRVGTGFDELLRHNAERGVYGEGPIDELVADLLERFANRLETIRVRLRASGRTIEIRSAPMPDGGIVRTYADITEMVAAQDALERANETLERRVRERTGELMRLNEELGRAKAEAEAANISKTRFLAAASHDILQPLNAARLYVTSLVERTAESGEAGLVRNVDASLDAVEEILSALIEISRLDTGALRPEPSDFAAGELLAQLEVEFAPLAREQGLELVFVPSRAVVRSDKRLLRRMLQNLVSNAIKYTKTGKVLVGCRRSRRGLRFEVWDTGYGIPASQHEAIFREFHRLERGMRAARGAGLGLSIVERVAKVLGHRLALRSEEGRGSVFSIEVPYGTARIGTIERPRPASAPAPLADLLVLCIDNEPDVLDGMRTLLAHWGCRPLTALDLDGALALIAASGPPDVVLADYHLDHADGLAVVERIRAVVGAPVPAMLLTADSGRPLRQAARALGIHVLPKPVKPAALRALLALVRTTRVAAE